MASKSRHVPVRPARIMLPKDGVDMTRWAVIACDQFTSHKAYWDALRTEIGDSPSTLHMMLPEADLHEAGRDVIASINKTMDTYVKEGILEDKGEMFVLVERMTAYGRRRLGLVCAIDLECYGFLPGTEDLIRATEDTIIARIPPRVLIRKDATLELTHVMALIDDGDKGIIKALDASRKASDLLYDMDLSMGGGHVRGYAVKDTKGVIRALESCMADASSTPFLVVGDGNHSLASAKAHWDHLKDDLTPQELLDHPARYAMVEIVSLHDDGLCFEGIHRVIFNADLKTLKEQLGHVMQGEAETVIVTSEGRGSLSVPILPHEAYDRLQTFLAGYLRDHPEVSVDYVHGDDEVERICLSRPDALGIIMPRLRRTDLFDVIAQGRVLPLKSFSIGHATEKRYYVEARPIVNTL